MDYQDKKDVFISKFVIIVLIQTIVITSVVIGGVYWWQLSVNSMMDKNTNLIRTLQNQITKFQQQITELKATNLPLPQ